jgi:hypothetical protein
MLGTDRRPMREGATWAAKARSAAYSSFAFLLSLKSLLETGKGAPWPNEIKLDSWE